MPHWIRTAWTGVGRAAPALLLPALVSMVVACSVNPATGERQLSLIGEEREIAMGRQADEEIVSTMGVVQNEALDAYVSGIGSELAAASERPDLPWTFRVIDDPTVNAFALPGGFIYVTRGMLAHLDSEAQLAGILGHEIGHVTARHSVNRLSRAQLANLGLGLGMIAVPELREFGRLAGAGLQLLFLEFSRDDEHESDRLGVRYMTELGYEPAALSRVFAMLERKSEGAGGSLPSWASTHPAPGDRQGRILAMADTTPGADRVDRRAYLAQVDDVVFGSDPRNGFFQEGAFHHPVLRFRFDVPRGWQGTNGARVVQLSSPEGEAAFALRLAEASSPQAAAEDFVAETGVRVTDRDRSELNGLPATWLAFTASTDGGDLRGRAVFPELDGRVYVLYGIAASRAWNEHRGTLVEVLSSFRRESDPSILDARPRVVDVVELDRPLALSTFMDRYRAEAERSTLALINQVWETDELPAGPVKRVVGR